MRKNFKYIGIAAAVLLIMAVGCGINFGLTDNTGIVAGGNAADAVGEDSDLEKSDAADDAGGKKSDDKDIEKTDAAAGGKKSGDKNIEKTDTDAGGKKSDGKNSEKSATSGSGKKKSDDAIDKENAAGKDIVYEYEIDENVDYDSTAPVKDGSAADNFAVTPDVEIKYHFRNEGLWSEHFEKHGDEFPYDSKEDYLLGANIVLQNPDVLHKKEKEDNDDVYYLEATNEFIIVSEDGYIRTYFKPTRGKAYYNSQ